MKIVILGHGRMGSWFASILSNENEVYVYDRSEEKRKSSANVTFIAAIEDIKNIKPELVLNSANHNDTFAAFDAVLPLLSAECALADVTPVKSGIQEFYAKSGRKFVSLHPMFNPQQKSDFSSEYAVIIKESDPKLAEFFRKLFSALKLHIYDYTFNEHDDTTAFTLAVPFISSMVFASCTKLEDAPGTTYHKHLDITKGLMSEDDYVLAEILFNPKALAEIEKISSKLSYLTHIIKAEDYEEVHKFFDDLRANIK